MKNKVKERLIHAKAKTMTAAQKFTVGLAASAAALGVPVTTYAGDFEPAGTADGSSIVDNIVTTVGNILTWAGVLVLIAAVVAYLLAFRNEDVEGKHKAGLAFAIGIAMVGFPSILGAIGIIS